jgi:hypothetical protein
VGITDVRIEDKDIIKEFVLKSFSSAAKMRAWVGEVDSMGGIFNLPKKGVKNAIAENIATTIEREKEAQDHAGGQ